MRKKKKDREKNNAVEMLYVYHWWSFYRDHPMAAVAVNDLVMNSGLPAEKVLPMLREVSVLPGLWREMFRESPEARKERRTNLEKQIQQLAHAIEQDPEACNFHVFDENTVITSSFENKPTITKFLMDFSNLYKDCTKNPHEDVLSGKTTTRMKLHEFVSREVARLLMLYLGNPKRKPITAAMNLTNALLCGAVPYYQNTVTYDQVKQTFRQIKTRGV